MRLERKAGPDEVGLAGQEPGFWLLCRGWRAAEGKERQEAVREGPGIQLR